MTDWTRCPQCGTKLDPSDSACRNCGAAAPLADTVISGDVLQHVSEEEIDSLAEELKEALAPQLILLHKFGEGGMGTVYLARDPALKRLVVVKVLSPALGHDPTARELFKREARAAAAVQHPNVVKVFQVGELPKFGTNYFVMEYVDGVTVNAAFPEGGSVPENTATRIVAEVAAALAAAHERGLVHRDIKPANVMIEHDTGRAVVLDFGISAAITPDALYVDGTLTESGIVVGTPTYMSPEQASGDEATDKSDVYSLGILAYELLTGRPPFESQSPAELIDSHLRDKPASVGQERPDLSPQAIEIIDLSLSKEPVDRPTAEDVRRALHGAETKMAEWPPSGLHELRARSRLFFRSLGALAFVSVFALYLSTGVGNIVGFADLLSAIQSPFATSNNAHYGAAFAVWMLLYFVSWAAALILVPLLSIRAWELSGQVRWARRSGYPWKIVSLAALDFFNDTESLINGRGPYAVVDPAGLIRLTKQRCLVSVLIVSSMITSIASLHLATATHLLSVSRLDTGVFSWIEFHLVLLPTYLILIAAGGLWVSTAYLRSRYKRSVPFIRKREPEVLAASVVNSWLAQAGLSRSVSQRSFPRTAFVVAAGVPSIAALVSVWVIGWTVDMSAGRSVRINEAAVDWRNAVIASTSRRGWPRIRAVSSFANIDAEETDLDSLREKVFRLPRVALVSVPLWQREIILAIRQHAFIRADSLIMVAGSRPDARIELSTWRQAVRRHLLSGIWPRESLSDSSIQSNHFGLYAETNLLVALREHSRKDTESALVRVRENLAYAAQLAGGTIRNAETARRALSEALEVGHFIARTSRDEFAITEFNDLGVLETNAVWDPELMQEAIYLAPYLMEDVEWLGAFSEVSDPEVVPYARLALVQGVVDGFCLRPREIMFGINPERASMLDSAGTLVDDIPGAREWMERLGDLFDAISSRPQDVVASLNLLVPLPSSLAVAIGHQVRWRWLETFGARLAYCNFTNLNQRALQ